MDLIQKRKKWFGDMVDIRGKMYKVLYIGFLTSQLISVFCNLKSSKKDILEAHNSRKFNIIGIVCQIIAVIFIMIILKMQG